MAFLRQQGHVSCRPSPGVEKAGGYLSAQGAQDAFFQGENDRGDDRHVLHMEAFRIPCLLWQQHLP